MDEHLQQAVKQLAQEICDMQWHTPNEIKIYVEKRKKQIGASLHLSKTFHNSLVLSFIDKSQKQYLLFKQALIKRPMRTISGVTPIAIMTRPVACPGKCIYCPKGKDAPQSYTGFEPAALRARQNFFDPKKQIRARINQYEDQGHLTQKCEVIIMGGTFLSQDKQYKDYFVKSIYDELNGFVSKDIETAKKLNENAKHRVVGLTIETRPDFARKPQIDEMLTYGATRVEIGVQTLSDQVYKIVKRGHTVQDVIDATEDLKNSSYKICYHMMPGLFSSPSQDISFFKTLFSDQRFQPDMIKIYPTLVMPGTELYDMWQKGEYTPYTTEQAAEVISEVFRYIPKYVRVMRIQRDIPSNLVGSGVKKTNLRQFVNKKLNEKNIKPMEIRSREIGLLSLKSKLDKEIKWELTEYTYKASNGTETFISFENIENNALAAFLRLRYNFKYSLRPEIDINTALIRELHVYGYETAIGKAGNWIQHKGFGKRLIERAIQISKEKGMKKLLVISGVGVKNYYRKFGFKDDGPYVSLMLS